MITSLSKGAWESEERAEGIGGVRAQRWWLEDRLRGRGFKINNRLKIFFEAT